MYHSMHVYIHLTKITVNFHTLCAHLSPSFTSFLVAGVSPLLPPQMYSDGLKEIISTQRVTPKGVFANASELVNILSCFCKLT